MTQAHFDHCGRIPILVKQGFHGRIVCTEPTRELAKIILLDAANLQEEEYERWVTRVKDERQLEKYFEEGAVYANKKPLYTAADVEAIMPFIDVCPYGTSVNINQNFEFRLRDAGHILGSAFMKFWISTEAGRTRKIGFSGDLGQPGARIIPDNRDQMSDDYPSYGLRKGGGEFDENVDYFYNS